VSSGGPRVRRSSFDMSIVRHQKEQIADGRLQCVDHVGTRKFRGVRQHFHERGIAADRVFAAIVQIETVQKLSIEDLKRVTYRYDNIMFACNGTQPESRLHATICMDI